MRAFLRGEHHVTTMNILSGSQTQIAKSGSNSGPRASIISLELEQQRAARLSRYFIPTVNHSNFFPFGRLQRLASTEQAMAALLLPPGVRPIRSVKSNSRRKCWLVLSNSI